ncbi:V-type ATP synthase subunit E [Nitrosopumilus cobalaminigenes]|uniref:A-type ATP synthase subunit E n=1 Tax=Nitrosopumilus cobalaminigenes TaxID=1470066 RepID=A0A7D5M3M5_9ARCH|nr:V-type ATP synthase subunit E [Nitrosopumilus cobalaminigenes]QLH03608.1 V-type ATP synthase subunit E [Nitrosopumilus cobalaminigenes]
MDKWHPLANIALEQTIDKILLQTEKEIESSIDSALSDSNQTLDDAIPKLEQEYDKIIADGKKEADKIEKQIIGSADIEARNKQLLALEESVDKVFVKALDEIANTDRSGDYTNLIKSLLDESTKILGTTEVLVSTNSKDRDVVQSALSGFPGSELSSDTIQCIGGVIIKSKDGAMTFDNTLDARIERLKPLIRKDIAAKFGVNN